MHIRRLNKLLVLVTLVACACKFPEPTRIGSSERSPSSGSGFTTSSPNEKKSDKPQDLQTQVQELRADHQSSAEDWDQKFRTLQDKIDILEHNVQEEQKRNEKITQDIDRRLLDLEKKNSSVIPSTAPVASAPVAVAPTFIKQGEGTTTGGEKNFASPIEQEYQTILDTFLEQKAYDSAIKDFKKFVQKYPNEQLTSNAQYWIGEGYYSKKDYPKAITEFQKVIDQYPNSTKRCDALLKQGMSFSNMKDNSNSKLFLKETIDQCPGTDAAKKASKLL